MFRMRPSLVLDQRVSSCPHQDAAVRSQREASAKHGVAQAFNNVDLKDQFELKEILDPPVIPARLCVYGPC